MTEGITPTAAAAAAAAAAEAAAAAGSGAVVGLLGFAPGRDGLMARTPPPPFDAPGDGGVAEIRFWAPATPTAAPATNTAAGRGADGCPCPALAVETTVAVTAAAAPVLAAEEEEEEGGPSEPIRGRDMWSAGAAGRWLVGGAATRCSCCPPAPAVADVDAAAAALVEELLLA